MKPRMSRICVVHLVRAANEARLLEAFLESYGRHEAGIAHDLVIVFKGFDDDASRYDNLLAGVNYRAFFVSDNGFDIDAYFIAARALDYRYFCFLNSYSVILADDWLAKLHEHISREEVGIVGATASYESHYTNLWRSVKSWRQYVSFANLISEASVLRCLIEFKVHFDSFPNYHMRPNAFMILRETMLKLRYGGGRSKMNTLRFEAGRRGMTRQIFAMNQQALVVGRDGQAYEKERWYESRTFRSGEQRNLLIADNRTNEYLSFDDATKKSLIFATWGRRPEDVREL